MRVTVCQLPDASAGLEDAWPALVVHVREERSEFVLLPELPFSPWFPARRGLDDDGWRGVVQAHAIWRDRLAELAPAAIALTEPRDVEGERHNVAAVLDGDAAVDVHAKRFLPDEEGFWEASCYARGPDRFETATVRGASIGFLICTEMWFGEKARGYGQAGAHLLACPRATASASADKWLAGGRAAAVMAGAFGLSSNRGTGARPSADGIDWAGLGWIVDPEEGDVLGTTDESRPFLTLELDLTRAERAKTTYPRYVRE